MLIKVQVAQASVIGTRVSLNPESDSVPCRRYPPDSTDFQGDYESWPGGLLVVTCGPGNKRVRGYEILQKLLS